MNGCTFGVLLSKVGKSYIVLPWLLVAMVTCCYGYLMPFFRGYSDVLLGSLLKSTRERKFLAYQLIEKHVLPTVCSEDVGVVLSLSLFHQIYTSTRVIHHPLYEASMHLVSDVVINCC